MAEIIGHVDTRNRPIIPLSLPGLDDHFLVVVDTGFNGELLIDDADVHRLRCEVSDYSEPVELANRERHLLVRGRSQIIWFGRLQNVNVFIARTGQSRSALADEPVAMIGTALLSPHKLIIDFTARRVVITENQD